MIVFIRNFIKSLINDKKKYLYLVALSILCAIVFSGCVRANCTIEVKSNGKTDISALVAVGANALSQYTGEEVDPSVILSEEEIEKIKDNGWNCESYNEDGFLGYKIIKSDIETSQISDTVKNMLLLLGGSIEADTSSALGDFSITRNDNLYTLDWKMQDGEQSEDNPSDYKDYFESMGGYATIVISLPSEPISSNASSVSADGKTLTWNLLDSEFDGIHIEYKSGTSIVTVAVAAAVIAAAIVIIIILLVRRRKKKMISDNAIDEIN